MPGPEGTNAPFYAERLSIPRRWWAIAAVGVAVGGAEVFGGFSWRVALIVYAALGIPTLALLIGMGREQVRVDADGLHAGPRVLPLAQVRGGVALDRRETRHRLGPGADISACVVVRGFIPTSVLVRPTPDVAEPYWLVSTRHPADLLAALEQACRQSVSRQ